MPELPEVEVSRLGITPWLQDQVIQRIVVRDARLRWPIPADIVRFEGQPITAIRRRAKYLLIETPIGTLILHLGMSGKLRVIPHQTPVQKHDHVDLQLGSGQALRLNDPRRFGCLLWSERPEQHELLAQLGPEPLSEAFSGEYLAQQGAGRTTAIKNLIMDNKVVVGVGNIYANESLYRSGIHPKRAAGRISAQRYDELAAEIKTVLEAAIQQGGTTLKDFAQVDGSPGYFAQTLFVYGRGGLPCFGCGATLKELRLGQRTTVLCPHCQH